MIEMLVTRYFVFVHVPKTGGVWVKSVIPEEWWVEALNAHELYENLPIKYANLPVLAFVRNPWDWYVSLYEYGREREVEEDEDTTVHDLFFKDGTFDSLLRTALFSQEIPYYVGRLMRECGLDYYSALFKAMTDPRQGLWVGRFENLREDFLSFADAHDVYVSPELRRKVLESPRVNTSERKEYRHYYDDELRRLVETRAEGLIADFGYEF
jgi:hypothetical protein